MPVGWYSGPYDFSHRSDFSHFSGPDLKADRFAAWLAQRGIAWPRLPSGALALDDDTFREIARSHPVLSPLRELRISLSQMRLNELAVGADGRNRCLLSPFASRTGRNQPSNTKFIFGPSVWLRGLIRPEPGMAVAYLDYEQQEFGVGAALSGDRAMIDAYVSGDPYLAFARQAGAAPSHATKETHAAERDQFKVCLTLAHGDMGCRQRAGQETGQFAQPVPVSCCDCTGPRIRRTGDGQMPSETTLPCIGTFSSRHRLERSALEKMSIPGASEISHSRQTVEKCSDWHAAWRRRKAFRVCCPVHDAPLIEAEAGEIDDAVRKCQAAMEDASRIVFGTFTIRTEAKVVRYPGRYLDKRGLAMWNAVAELVGGFDQ